MANVRINALTTTASLTSSDDYIAIDGATNGTRKLSAFSPAFGGGITSTAGAITSSTPMLSGTQEWTGGATFTGLKLNVTDTLSAAGSLLLDLQKGGVSQFKVDKSGNATFAGLTCTGITSTNQTQFFLNTVCYNTFAVETASGLTRFGSFPYSIGIAKNATDVLEVNSGTAGTFRDLKLRSLLPTAGTIAITTPAIDASQTWNSAITVTGASGNGTTATLTFAAMTTAFPVGSSITVTSVNPSGYNGTFTVTASTTTSVSYANTTTGAWVSGGSITQNFTAIKSNVVDQASGTSSLLMDLQVGGTTKANIAKDGRGYFANGISTSGSIALNPSENNGTIYSFYFKGAGLQNWIGGTFGFGNVAGFDISQGLYVTGTNSLRFTDVYLLRDTWNVSAQRGIDITVTGASGTGTTATLTFAAIPSAIPVGAVIVVTGINPSGYNGTYTVTASTTTSVSYANATSSAWVSGGAIYASQSYRLYNTYTSATNYERLGINWTSNVAQIYTEKGSGGGTARDLVLGTDATTAITIGGTTQKVTIASGKDFQVGSAYVATPQVNTGYITIYDNTGTAYKVLVST